MSTHLAIKQDLQRFDRLMAIRFEAFERLLSLRLEAMESRIVLKLGALMIFEFAVAIAAFVLLR